MQEHLLTSSHPTAACSEPEVPRAVLRLPRAYCGNSGNCVSWLLNTDTIKN